MKWFLTILVAVVILLHQDFWNWENKTLLFGFLPVGLAYHAMYSVVAAIIMFLLVKFAWPSELEKTESLQQISIESEESV